MSSSDRISLTIQTNVHGRQSCSHSTSAPLRVPKWIQHTVWVGKVLCWGAILHAQPAGHGKGLSPRILQSSKLIHISNPTRIYQNRFQVSSRNHCRSVRLTFGPYYYRMWYCAVVEVCSLGWRIDSVMNSRGASLMYVFSHPQLVMSVTMP